MKKFVFNMGFDSSHVISVLTSEGIDDGSEIHLLTPTEVPDRQRNAVREIENYVDSVDVESEVITVDDFGQNFSQRVLGLGELLQDLEEVVLSLSGGPRDYLIPLAISASLNSDCIEKTYFRSDIDNELDSIELPEMPNEISGPEKDMLETVEEGDTVKELVNRSGKSQSTVYELLDGLESKGLVRSEGSPSEYSLTLTGMLMV